MFATIAPATSAKRGNQDINNTELHKNKKLCNHQFINTRNLISLLPEATGFVTAAAEEAAFVER